MAGKGAGQVVNRSGLAALFGVSLPTVDTWVRKGCPVITRGSRGIEWEFDSAAVIDWRRQEAIKEAVGTAPADETELNRRRLVADTERAELELLKARGVVASVDEMERTWARTLAALQVNILAVPQRAVLQLLGETDETVFKAKLRAELVEALEQSATEALTDVDEEDPDAHDADR